MNIILKMRFLTILFCLFPAFVWASTLPSANLSIQPSVGVMDQPIVFLADDSRNTRGQKTGLKYRFRVHPDEKWTEYSHRSQLSYVPRRMGSFKALLQVRDQDGRTSTTYRTYKVREHSPRYARIEVINPHSAVGKPVYFRLKLIVPSSEDPEKVLVRWDFEGDGTFDTGFNKSKLVSHIYSAPGRLNPVVQIRWPEGWEQTIRGLQMVPVQNSRGRSHIPSNRWNRVNLTHSALVPPVVDHSPSASSLYEGTIVRFDAHKSPLAQDGWIEWLFDGQDRKTGKKVEYAFDSPGTHRVLARSCYRRSKPECRDTEIQFQIKPRRIQVAPEIRITNHSHPGSGGGQKPLVWAVVGDELRFHASVPHRGQLSGKTQYRWDFEGDGIFDTPFSVAPWARYTFSRAGKFTPRVEILTDRMNALSQMASSKKMVWVENNTAPTGRIVVKPKTIYPRDKVTLTAEVYDAQTPQGQLQMRWDTNGDGIWETDFRGHRIYTGRFDTPGTYPVVIQVRDKSGEVKTFSKEVLVSPFPSPKARVVVSDKFGTVNKTSFRFDAKGSQGHMLQYVWHFPEDTRGLAKYTSANSQISKRFLTPGRKDIVLEVIDGSGQRDRVEFPVFVREGAGSTLSKVASF